MSRKRDAGGRPRNRVAVPERGRRIDAYVRKRWSQWLTAILENAGIARDDLARELATNPEDKQTWPRGLVRRWLNQDPTDKDSVTVSSANAYAVGEALFTLSVPTCGHEAVFMAGHIPAYIGSLEYVAESDALTAARLAMLPRMRCVQPSGIAHIEDAFESAVAQARDQMDELLKARPPKELREAWDRYQQRKPIPIRKAEGLAAALDARQKSTLEEACNIAGAQSIHPDMAARLALEILASWALSLWIPNIERDRLQAIAYAYEDHEYAVRQTHRNSYYELFGPPKNTAKMKGQKA
jgi:hypothetical protein